MQDEKTRELERQYEPMRKCERVIFSCNTYMQLMTAIQIRRSICKEARADILLSDHSVGAQKVCECLQETGLFDRALNVKSKFITFSQSQFEDMKDVVSLTLDTGGRYKKALWDDCCYDAVFYYNTNDYFSLYVYGQSVKAQKSVLACRFEEGILSCAQLASFDMSRRTRAIMSLRGLLNKKNMMQETKDIYCYYPSLFSDTLRKCHPIPILKREDEEYVKTVNTIFGYDPQANRFAQRYIFFASSSDIDGIPVGETELVLQIAELVGRENLLVKMHPRDSRNVYEKEGISVSRDSSVPWEVIQLNHDFSDHVFLTVSSGSVLNASAMLGDRIPTYYLYPLVRGRNARMDRFCEKSIFKTISALQSMGFVPRIRIVDDLQTILKRHETGAQDA